MNPNTLRNNPRLGFLPKMSRNEAAQILNIPYVFYSHSIIIFIHYYSFFSFLSFLFLFFLFYSLFIFSFLLFVCFFLLFIIARFSRFRIHAIIINSYNNINYKNRENSPPEKIKQAHRLQMQLNHPDMGGSMFVATKINEAKDRLLSRTPDDT